MTKKIFPGNFVNYLSSYQGQPIVAQPGVVFHHLIGYAKITDSATSWDVIIPSPDKRPDDKPRPDITGLVVPTDVWLYKLGIRVLDVRKDLGRGTASSGLVGTNTDRIKLSSAVDVASTITATTGGTAPIAVADGTIAPGEATHAELLLAPVLTTSAITFKVFNDNAAGTAAGSGLSSSELGGSYVVAEACYFALDEVPNQSAFGGLPAIVETV